VLALAPERREALLRSLGGHPRVLEFADALLRRDSQQATEGGRTADGVTREIEARIATLAKRRISALRAGLSDSDIARSVWRTPFHLRSGTGTRIRARICRKPWSRPLVALARSLWFGTAMASPFVGLCTRGRRSRGAPRG
jgi:hypothetical protein